MPKYFDPTFTILVNNVGLAADVSKNIQQLSVTTKPDSLDEFSFTVVNAYPKMRWTHTPDANLFAVGSSVTIELGYVEYTQAVFQGEITKISPTFPDSGMPTVAIEGHTCLHWLERDKKTQTFQKMTDAQIVAKIAQDAGLTPNTEDSQVQHDYVIQSNQTDLQFIKSRAEQIHFEVLAEGKKLIFRRAKEDQPKMYTLVWAYPQSGLGPDPDSLPLQSFTPTMNTTDQPSSVTVQGYDPSTKQAVSGKAQIGDEYRQMGSRTGPQVAQDAAHKPREFVRVGPLASQAELDQMAKAAYNDKAMQFVQGSGTTIGLPDLRAGNVIELLGLGPIFNGLYYVDEATHTIGQDGYRLSFTVKRNAVQ
jgi:Bacteriophage probable baseplate hub protein